jgi:hypothetical protein
MARRTAFIFDIDGVLVEPKGYSAAVRATQAYFTHAMGLRDGVLVNDATYALFEACRVTSEWDMVPIALTILLEEIFERHPELSRSEDLEACIQAIQQLPPDSLPEEIDYRTPIQALGPSLRPGNYPASQVLKREQGGLANPKTSAEPGPTLFPLLARSPILEKLLAHTRDVAHSPTTRLFQQFSLGSQAFTQTYHLKPDIETPGFLLKYDRPLISQDLSNTLIQHYQSGNLALCAYTMRPSLPAREAEIDHTGYSPEAEMALNLVNLTGIPLIGYGRIQNLAEQTGRPAEEMLKPSPIQAIAAILAALTGQEWAALQTALRIYQGELLGSESPIFDEKLSIHIFEDSAGGIEAMLSAGTILTHSGMNINIHPCGISKNPEKEASLRQLQVPIFPTTESAVKAALVSESFEAFHP